MQAFLFPENGCILFLFLPKDIACFLGVKLHVVEKQLRGCCVAIYFRISFLVFSGKNVTSLECFGRKNYLQKLMGCNKIKCAIEFRKKK